MVNSASVAGGCPAPWHCRKLPQSPVSHGLPPCPLAGMDPVVGKLQFVRAHTRPFQSRLTVCGRVSPGLRRKPELSGGVPSCVRIAGQMASLQLLVTRKGRVCAAAASRRTDRRKNPGSWVRDEDLCTCRRLRGVLCLGVSGEGVSDTAQLVITSVREQFIGSVASSLIACFRPCTMCPVL